jgi:hypothetical protein
LFENLAGNTDEETFFNELPPVMVGQSRDSFTLLRVKEVVLFQQSVLAGHSNDVQ